MNLIQWEWHLTAKLTNLWPSFPDRIGIWSVVFFLWREENQRTRRKTFGAGTRNSNKLNPHVASGPGEYSHHCTIPAFSWKKQEFPLIVSFHRHNVKVMVDVLGGAVFLELDDGHRCREVAIRLHEVLVDCNYLGCIHWLVTVTRKWFSVS